MIKNLFIALHILLLAPIGLQAQSRGVNEAAGIAQQFLASKGLEASAESLQQVSIKNGRRLVRQTTKGKHMNEGCYLFITENSGQLLVVSGDERMPNILGYTDGRVDGKALPEGLVDLLEGYKAQYKALTSSAASLATPPLRTETLHKGEQLLPTAEWGQWTPFNSMTPKNYPTGCAATAMAIVMRYHQWPNNGALCKTHIWKDSVMVADFANTHYDWDNMPMSYSSYTSAQAKAVALLMRHAGISVEMYYDAESSGARQTLVPGALSTYFRYAATARLVSASDYDAATWNEMMRKEIDAKQPVIYTGESTQGRGSHGFVLDGYRDNLFHFNFGWNGSGNGYFAVSALANIDKRFEFANKQQAVIGIKPLKEIDCAPLTLNSEGSYEGYYTTLSSLVAKDVVNIHLSKFTALRDWTGKLRWNLCHADGSCVESLAEKSVTMRGGATQGVDFAFTAAHSAVKGDYLQLVACEDTSSVWKVVTSDAGKEVVVAAYDRKVPIVEVVCHLKHATIDDKSANNITYDGKPMLGSTYRFKAIVDDEAEKTLVQVKRSGKQYRKYDNNAMVLTTDTLYIKAKGYKRSELVSECAVHLDKAGSLQEELNKQERDADAIESLTVTGVMNNDDVQYLSTLQSLKSVNLENVSRLQGVFGMAFKDFERLESCKLPRSLKQLGSETFENCSALKYITLPVSLQDTGEKLFVGCRSLKDINVLSSSPNCVADGAFAELPNPTNVTIHVQQGLTDVFKNSAKWSGFTNFVDDLMPLPQKFAYNGIEYIAIYQGDGNYAEVAIPSGTMYAGDITIPSTITYGGMEYKMRGFANTDGLSPFVGNPFVTSLNLQLDVDTLRPMLFMGCTNLSTLQLPSKLRYIGSECFRNCPMLMQVTLPASVEALGDNAFCGCQYLTDIYCHAMVPPTGSEGDNYPFAQCRPQNVTLHVPTSCEELYRSAGFWSKFQNVVGDLQPVISNVANVGQYTEVALFPTKSMGKQWLKLHLDKPLTIAIYNLNGTLLRRVKLICGDNNIWLEQPCILKAE